jgi:NAD(P)-dependent dehydrogenase (short-subunit alcohol dehydrogenase family)
MKLSGKVAIVTGGAMGNGLGIVKTFLRYGARVIVIDYSDKLTESLREQDNPMLLGYQADLREKEVVEAIVDDVIEKFGRIDILVNNAGIAKLERFLDMDDSIRDRHFDINIKGTWNITKCVLPHMVKANYGKIVNLSSVTGPMVADSGEVAYATTKAALLGFTKSLAMELVTEGINVNAIMPGYILTPLVENMAKVSNPDNPQSIVDGIAAGIPMGRLGTIEELGDLAAFLASDASSYITGQGIVIDGASTLPETKVMGV